MWRLRGLVHSGGCALAATGVIVSAKGIAVTMNLPRPEELLDYYNFDTDNHKEANDILCELAWANKNHRKWVMKNINCIDNVTLEILKELGYYVNKSHYVEYGEIGEVVLDTYYYVIGISEEAVTRKDNAGDVCLR